MTKIPPNLQNDQNNFKKSKMSKILPLNHQNDKSTLKIVEMTKIPSKTSKTTVICLETLGTDLKLFKVAQNFFQMSFYLFQVL